MASNKVIFPKQHIMQSFLKYNDKKSLKSLDSKIIKVTSSKSCQAFTLIELSVVLIIISLLIGSFMGAETILNNARYKNAQKLTQAAPITGFYNDEMQSSALAWFDILDENSITIANDKVTAWHSKISNHIMAQATTNDQPSYLSNAHKNFPAIDFDGSGVFLESNHIIAKGDDTYTLSAVTIVDTNGMIFNQEANPATNGERAAIRYQNSAFIFNGHNNDVSSSLGVTGRIYAITITVDNGAIAIYVNNDIVTGNLNAETLNISTDYTVLGKHNATSSGDLDGQIFEVAIFDKALSETEAKQLQDYFIKKYSID